MDTASFSMSVASLAIQVFGAACDGYSSLRQMKDPQNPLADMVDLQVQQCRFMSWAKATGFSDERLSQFGDSFMQQTVLNVLCNMLQLLQDAVSPTNGYGLVFQDPSASGIDLLRSPQQASAGNAPVDGPPDVRDSESASTIARPEKAQALIISARASFSAFQQFQWMVSDRRLFQILIRRLRETNDNLEALLPRPVQISAAEIGETAILQSDDPKYLKCVAQVTSNSWVSLAQSADFKSSFIDSDTNRDAVNHAVFIPRARLALDNSNDEARTLATYENHGPYSGRVFVEWKRVGVLKKATSTKESERIVLDRIKRLVIILACPSDASFRSLACLGYTTSVSGRIGMVFKLPDGAAKAYPLVSLYDLLKKSDPTKFLVKLTDVGNTKSTKPALEDRLRLAHALALSLYRLHRTGVIHKRVAPANIVFFQSKSTSTISIREPFLTGLGFAREESMVNQSEIPDGTIDGEELYRHPSCGLGKASTKA
jgi:hypothetical protein